MTDLKQKYKRSMSEILGGSVRHTIHAPEGKSLVIADLSSIESVVLGWVTECKLIDSTFREGRDSYKVFASKYFGIDYEEVTKAQRGFSKPPVLGCFSEETKVLTDRGWVPIIHVSETDKVFDGIDFVSHYGVVYQGVKECETKYGVTATPDHEFLIEEDTWCQFKDLTETKAAQAISLVNGRYRSTGARVTGWLRAAAERLKRFI